MSFKEKLNMEFSIKLYNNILYIAHKWRDNVFFWLTYKMPLKVHKGDYASGKYKSKDVVVPNGIFAFVEYYHDRKIYQRLAQVSGQYEALDHFTLYDGKLDFDASSGAYYFNV